MTTDSIQKRFLQISVFWLPVPITLLMAMVWMHVFDNPMLTTTAVALPLLYGYVIPGIGINVLKNWRFTNGLRFGGMYIHHGFLYAWKMSLFGFFPMFYIIKDADFDIYHRMALILLTTLPYSVLACLEDALCVKYRFVELGHDSRNGRHENSPSLLYAPVCFALIGLIYSASLTITYLQCCLAECSRMNYIYLFALSFLALSTFPSVAFKFFTE